ncbi:MAG TPA: DALR domain-containing protein, partial [Nocardioidaceae bacterium]|nr:DALR domain-containing protein [Nocardioidaceae bacterium]
LIVPAVLERVRPIELRYYIVAAHYRSHVEFSFEALDEAAAGFRRIEHFLTRAAELVGGVPTDGMLCAEFVEAMDDDLGTPAAMAAVYDVVREGNKLLAAGDSPALRGNAASVRAMLDVLGLDPFDPHWAGGDSHRDEKLTGAVNALVAGLLEQREAARADKDFAAADAIRDQLKAAGFELEDTPQGPKWNL